MVAVKLLRDVEEVRRLYNRKWKYILVDEFQDTNRAQLQFLRYLTEDQQNICVVGDDDQSIYSWRGAEVRNILDFEKLYEGTKVVTLDRNYRSTQQILECSNAVIEANMRVIKRRCGLKLKTDANRSYTRRSTPWKKSIRREGN
jgi:DNA helicase-2/ATP-dependent DNA helicase PcrA